MTTATATAVTVKDLASGYNMAAREIRVIIRSLGINAPALQTEGFGPRAKYEWTSNSPELLKIRKALLDTQNAKKNPKAVTKKATPAPVVKPEETDDEDLDDEDDDDTDAPLDALSAIDAAAASLEAEEKAKATPANKSKGKAKGKKK